MMLDGGPTTIDEVDIHVHHGITITTTGGAAGAARPASTACPVAGLSGRLEKSALFMNHLAQPPRMLIITCLSLSMKKHVLRRLI